MLRTGDQLPVSGVANPEWRGLHAAWGGLLLSLMLHVDGLWDVPGAISR